MILIILLIAASVSSMFNSLCVSVIVGKDVKNKDGGIMTWATIQLFANVGFEACFGCAHWLLAFEYFSIAKLMPLALKGRTISDEKARKYKLVKISFLVANVLVAAAEGIFEWLATYESVTQGMH